jgi:dihydropteroate synthase
LLAQRRCLVMGIVNVTPDSFSDGGQFLDPAAAVAYARAMVAESADLLDVGAESTRPYGGAVPVSADEEWTRLAPVLREVVAFGVPVSVDTMKADIAVKALALGASIVNDVWGLQRDPDMARAVAGHGAGVVIMHNRDRADPAIDIMADIEEFFARSLELAARAGIASDRIMLDPGIGFGKTPEQSIAVLGNLERLKRFALPLLVGASRKRFIALVSPAQPQERLGGSIAASVMGALSGAAMVRVHDVAATVQALRVTEAIRSTRHDTGTHG